MTSYVGAELRRSVQHRAGGFCRVHEDDTFVGCQVDHVIAEKHGGDTDLKNLAYACAFCNRAKGTDIASLLPGTQTLVRLFNPRIDGWDEHFRFDPTTLVIEPLSDIGRVTSLLLGFNTSERVLERESLVRVGRYPLEHLRS